MSIKEWFLSFSKKRNFTPTEDAVKRVITAEIALQKAQVRLEESTKIATTLRKQREQNHFSERWLLAYQGKEK